MSGYKLFLARRRLYQTRATKLVVIWLGLLSCIGCGMSIGSTAIGTTEFMQQHNRKVQIMLQTTPSEEQAKWVK